MIKEAFLVASRFVVFEGLDGAGKSTLLNLLRSELEFLKQNVVVTREPGGTPLGEELRKIILRKDSQSPSSRSELLLYEADRAHHVETLIKPNLENGKWVLSDRYSASSIAFQAGGRKIQEDQVRWLNEFATENLNPCLTILLDLPYEEAQRRQKERFANMQVEADRMESESRSFHERVRTSFLNQAEQSNQSISVNCEENPWLVLSALNSPDNLLQQLIQHMKGRGLWPSSSLS